MKLNITLAAILLAACGDNVSQPPTWEDAWAVWGESLCSYLERCYPEKYTVDDHADCVTAVTYDSCRASGHDCDDLYPEDRAGVLAACEVDMETLRCGSVFAPDSCREAFEL